MDNNNYKTTIFVLQSLQASIGMIGIIGNTLTFMIFLRRPLRTHSYAIYFWIMSWTDSIILAHTFRHWLRIVHNIDVDLLSPYFCQFNEYQPYLAGSISQWLRVLILFDRFIRVVYPAYFRVVRRRWFQFSALFIIFILSALLHSILPLNYRLQMTENSTNLICYAPVNIIGINFILLLFNLFICTLIAGLLNFKLISHIYLSRKRLRMVNISKSVFVRLRDRSFALSSIGISLVNFFCQITFATASLVVFNLQMNPDLMQLVLTASLTVTICAYGSLFFVSILTNSIYQKQFLGFFSSHFRNF